MRRAGEHAVLLELADNAAVQAAARAARARFGDMLVEVVPGHTTLLLVGRAGTTLDGLVGLEELERQPAATLRSESEPVMTIPTVYDGADLEDIAASLDISVEAVVALHTGAEYTVAFMGFMPGFPYLIGGPRELELPRLATPRTEVPAGSVAIAAGYCGIYPGTSPGGWRLLGHTDLTLFDPNRDPPALLEPGMRVRFTYVSNGSHAGGELR